MLGEDVPTTFKQLMVGRLEQDQPRLAGCLSTTTVRQIGVGLDPTIPTASYVLRF